MATQQDNTNFVCILCTCSHTDKRAHTLGTFIHASVCSQVSMTLGGLWDSNALTLEVHNSLFNILSIYSLQVLVLDTIVMQAF